MPLPKDFQKRVLITRQFEQSGSFVNILSDKGFYSYLLPMIETCQLCPTIKDGIYDVLVFTSANAVKYFTPYNDRVSARAYIAVGPKTAQAMEVYLGVSSGGIPVVHNLENIKSILGSMNLSGGSILTPGAKERIEAPREAFEGFGAEIIAPAVYETTFALYPKGFIENFLLEHRINVLTFCSPSAAKSFISQYRGDMEMYDIVSIGTTTAEYLSKQGIASRYPDEFTVEAMIELI